MPYVTWVGNRKLAGDVLGADLISTTDTTNFTGVNATLSDLPNGALRVTNSGAAAGWGYDSFAVTSGSLYQVDVTVTLGTATSVRVYVATGSSSGSYYQRTVTSSQTVSYQFIATGSVMYIWLANNTSTSGHYTDFTVCRVRALIARGHATTIEHIVNPDFVLDSQWSKGTGFTITGGKGVGTAGTLSNLSQLASVPVGGVRQGKVYDTSITVSGYSSGALTVILGANGSGTARTADGTFTEQVTANSNTTLSTAVFVQKNAAGAMSVDDVSVTLASGNSWSLDFDIAEFQPATPAMDVRTQTMLDGSQDTLYFHQKQIFNVTTEIIDYGDWQFFEEFARNAITQTFTFDPYGTEGQPKNPGSYRLVSWSPRRILGADTTERRQYQFQIRAA